MDLEDEEFEKVRDEIAIKVEQALRRKRLLLNLDHPSIYTLRDLGIKAQSVINQEKDKGITDHELNKTIDKIGISVEFQTDSKEKLACKWIEKFTSRGYLGYIKLMKMLDMPVESPVIRWWNCRYMNTVLSLVNPGGRYFIRAGTYPLSAQIGTSTRSNIELCGEGRATILRFNANVWGSVINVANVSGWYIHHLFVDGNNRNYTQTPSNKGGQNGVRVMDGSEHTIDHLYVYDSYNMGIQSRNCPRSMILNNYVNLVTANCIEATTWSHRNIIKGNIVCEASDLGINTFGSDECLMNDNIVFNIDNNNSCWGINSHWGIATEAASAPCYRSIISNNIVVGVARGIILSTNCNYNIVIGNIIYNYSVEAIDVDSTGNIVEHNLY